MNPLDSQTLQRLSPAEGYGRCDFDQGVWSEYMKASRTGEIRFQGTDRGQGIGNILTGLGRAIQLAVATKRNLKVNIDVGGVRLQDIMPIRSSGPVVFNFGAGGCSYSATAFESPPNTPLNGLMEAAKNSSKYPVFCLSGNFGPLEFEDKLLAALHVKKGSLDSKLGCALNFVLDPTKSRQSRPDTFKLVGHLRLGDAYMQDGGDPQDRGRPVVSTIFHDPKRAGVGFVDCMQGVAVQLLTMKGHKKCELVLISDNKEAKHEALLHAKKYPCRVVIDENRIARHSATHRFKRSEALGTINELLTIATADAALLTKSGFGFIGAAMGPILSGKAFRIEDILKGQSIPVEEAYSLCQRSKLQPI